MGAGFTSYLEIRPGVVSRRWIQAPSERMAEGGGDLGQYAGGRRHEGCGEHLAPCMPISS